MEQWKISKESGKRAKRGVHYTLYRPYHGENEVSTCFFFSEVEAHLQMVESTKELKEQQYHQHAEC